MWLSIVWARESMRDLGSNGGPKRVTMNPGRAGCRARGASKRLGGEHKSKTRMGTIRAETLSRLIERLQPPPMLAVKFHAVMLEGLFLVIRQYLRLRNQVGSTEIRPQKRRGSSYRLSLPLPSRTKSFLTDKRNCTNIINYPTNVAENSQKERGATRYKENLKCKQY